MIVRIVLLILVTCFAMGAAAQARTDIRSERSLYRNIVVYEDDGLRCMIFTKRQQNNSRQTCIKIAAPDELVFNFTKMMLGALYLNPHPKNILVIGLGGGTLPATLAKLLPDAHIDAVEVDKAVISVADKYFDMRATDQIAIHESDGRTFVKRAIGKQTYDLVMLDAFNEDYIPEHMLTRDFLNEVRQVMAPDGVLAANTFSNSALYDNESTTYEAVFGTFYNLKSNNRVILLRLGDLPDLATIKRNAAGLEHAYQPFGVTPDWLLPLFITTPDWKRDARVLTDQYSPSNLLNSMHR
jgi:spermidine synthase